MEKLLLKWVTGCSGVLTVLVCVCLYFFPEVPEAMVAVPEIPFSPEANIQEAPIEIVEDEEVIVDVEEKRQLQIELPEGIDGRHITINNDYLTQTVTVRFENGVEEYAQKYRVYGSSDKIASISYYKEKEEGVLSIQLDQVCEIAYAYDEGFLGMDFIDPHEIYDKVVVIDAGHGGRQPGAVKWDIYEKNINLAIVKEIKALFEQANDKSIRVYYTRLEDKNPSFSKRVELANRSNADLFVSIHNNAASDGRFTSRNGTLVLYNIEDKSEYSSKRFSEICLENVNATTGSNRRGIAEGNYVYIIRNSKVPVALVEVGYMTNRRELELLQTEEYQKKAALGVYNAILQAFEEGF